MRLLGKFGVVAVGLTAMLAMAPVKANAAVISCPGTAATTDREFTLDTTPVASCLAFGSGNINGNGDAVNALGYVTLDKSDDNTSGALQGALTITGSGTTAGTFTISPSVLLTYSSIVIAFKSGEGQLSPDWAAFLLPASVLSGSWTISGQQSLSHANLYGKLGTGGGGSTGGGGQTVPEPASMVLFGLATLAAARRARRS